MKLVLDTIRQEADDQRDEGRPLLRYICTPDEWQRLEDELVEMNITDSDVRPLTSLKLLVPGQTQPVEVIKGP